MSHRRKQPITGASPLAPKLEPKKIDGKWRIPLDSPIPEKLMRCPRCDKIAENTGMRSIDNRPIFRCRECRIEFQEGKKAKKAYCRKNNKIISGKDCRGCFLYKLYAKEWKSQNKPCPHFTKIDATPEGFERN